MRLLMWISCRQGKILVLWAAKLSLLAKQSFQRWTSYISGFKTTVDPFQLKVRRHFALIHRRAVYEAANWSYCLNDDVQETQEEKFTQKRLKTCWQ